MIIYSLNAILLYLDCKGLLIKIIFFLFISSFLLANQYPYFEPEEFANLAKSDYITKNRLLDYQKTMLRLKTKDKTKQLQSINFYLNQLLPQYDAVIQQKEDYWATPKEFLYIGYGDCEDYVIIKYYSLIKLGFDEKKLFITLVKEKFESAHHMVLTYFKTPSKAPLVLDNLSFKILTLPQRTDLNAELFINSSGVYTLDKNNRLQLVSKKYKAYEELKEKVAKNL